MTDNYNDIKEKKPKSKAPEPEKAPDPEKPPETPAPPEPHLPEKPDLSADALMNAPITDEHNIVMRVANAKSIRDEVADWVKWTYARSASPDFDKALNELDDACTDIIKSVRTAQGNLHNSRETDFAAAQPPQGEAA